MSQPAPYLIIGGGMAADAAVRGIRQVDTQHPILMFSAENDPPYNRPPLSKGLWKKGARQTPIARIWRGTEQLGVDLRLGRQITSLDAVNRQVSDDQGSTYPFDKLLLATGGDPIRPWPEHDRLVYFRNLADYHQLRALTENGQRFIIIGGGFIGSEIAAALLSLGKEVTIIFPESGIGARVLPGEISAHLNRLFSERGARVLAGQLVTAVQPGENTISVQTDRGEVLHADGVVAGLGIRPNLALAEQAGLSTSSNGIQVDAFLRTTHPDIYAAGDVINFYSPALGQRIRAEHEENANLSGQLAGMAMAGQPTAYETLPSVYSSLFDINYDAVGLLDPTLPVVYDWQEPFRKGTAYYMDEGRVRGVLLWNISRGLDSALQLIASGEPFQPGDMVGRIR